MRTLTWTTIDKSLMMLDREDMAARFAQDHPDADGRIWEYVDKVLTGEIRACQKVRMAVERFVRDEIASADPGYRWRFDGEAASRPIRFIEKWIRPRGNYERMALMPWQCFFFANVYGWVDRDTGERRFQKALLIVGSGNGKTPMAAGTALYNASQLGIRNPEIDILANSLAQARIMMDDICSAIADSPALRARFRTTAYAAKYFEDGIARHKRSDFGDGVIQARPNNPRFLDGLRPTNALFDEVHEMRTYAAIEQMRRSLIKAKGDQLLMMLSTMGYVLDGVLVSEYRLADQMLKGNGNPSVNDRFFALIYEINEDSDYGDADSWIEANPSLGVLLDLDDLKQRWEEGKGITDRMIDFITKTLNVFTRASAASFLDFELIERNRDMVGMEAVLGREAYGGFDVATSGDHCSVALTIPLDDGRFYVIQHTFVPRKVADLNRERLDYYAQAMAGRITIIDGEYVRQEYIVEWFEKMGEIFDIRIIGYDPANATLLVRTLETKFACEAVRQGALTLNAPMKYIKELFQDGLIVHDQNTLFEWYLNNVKLRKDFSTRDNENYVPKKMDEFSKIDGFMAFLDAMTVWLRYCPPIGVSADVDYVSYISLDDDEEAPPLGELAADRLTERANGGDDAWA